MDQALPNVPVHEGHTELKLTLPGVESSLSYRFLSERFSDPGDQAPSMGAAHLLGARVDVEVSSGWNIYLRLENILGQAWKEWKGYPSSGVTAVAGVRASF